MARRAVEELKGVAAEHRVQTGPRCPMQQLLSLRNFK